MYIYCIHFYQFIQHAHFQLVIIHRSQDLVLPSNHLTSSIVKFYNRSSGKEPSCHSVLLRRAKRTQ